MNNKENIQFVSPGIFFEGSSSGMIKTLTAKDNANTDALNAEPKESHMSNLNRQPKVTTLPMPSQASSSDEDVQITAIEFANILSPLKKNVSHRIPRFHVLNFKRFRQNDSEHEHESAATPKPLPYKFKRSFTVKNREMKSYFRLLDDPHIYEFLNNADICKRIADKYLLAMVFAYFKRADFSIRDYNRLNFFRALYLANDMEEDEEEYKYEIFPWALGKSWRKKYMDFLRKRDKLWAKLDFRGVVSKKCCDEIISIEPDHWAWQRPRPDHHAGALRTYDECSEDYYPIGPDATPRVCERCAKQVEYDSASPSSISWFLSSSSDSSPEVAIFPSTLVELPPRGHKTNEVSSSDSFEEETLPHDDDDIFAHEEE